MLFIFEDFATRASQCSYIAHGQFFIFRRLFFHVFQIDTSQKYIKTILDLTFIIPNPPKKIIAPTKNQFW
ncbi:hypothetical protein D2962_02425 [Biomaibacter acetigenes]|uniref:Uncharacterized protein n=1 Tax=Biomaibacter acetigenes TaxID=2316383 RepID=A0A3G2R2S7_9FIRM|nr:hypothetical protein D2962_02425 [Biomaibacter acetigenes]